MSLIDNLRKFSKRSWQERVLFVESFILLGVMRAAILLFPFRRITGIMGLTQGDSHLVPDSAMSVKTALIGWSIQAAAARTPWESACLVQALTGMVMLTRRGISATLYLGVAKDESGVESMAAHAWLCCDEAVLTGASNYERFTVLSKYCKSRPLDR